MGIVSGESYSLNKQPPSSKPPRTSLASFGPAKGLPDNRPNIHITEPPAGFLQGDRLAKRARATSATAFGTIFPQFEKDNAPGFLLLDTFLRPLYANEEAVSILAHPESSGDKKRLRYFLTERIASLLPKGDGSPLWKFSSEFVSGKRRYQLRAFMLKARVGTSLGPALAVLLERNHQKPLNRSGFAAKFHLTQREGEALDLLMHGQNTKQIASCMDISPNTAKAFLRSVMFKMGVCDRSGILAKILQVSAGVLEKPGIRQNRLGL